MRGTLVFLPYWLVLLGIIPAYAGNTGTVLRLVCGRRDHPRVCGEHIETIAVAVAVMGSSPRMRGTHGGFQIRPWVDGIIPAYAGNTWRVVRSVGMCRDHPRVCGEHINPVLVMFCLTGSSPRMRGTLLLNALDSKASRIIPAYAGNTSSPFPRLRRSRDHPRVCGEHTKRL